MHAQETAMPGRDTKGTVGACTPRREYRPLRDRVPDETAVWLLMVRRADQAIIITNVVVPVNYYRVARPTPHTSSQYRRPRGPRSTMTITPISGNNNNNIMINKAENDFVETCAVRRLVIIKYLSSLSAS